MKLSRAGQGLCGLRSGSNWSVTLFPLACTARLNSQYLRRSKYGEGLFRRSRLQIPVQRRYLSETRPKSLETSNDEQEEGASSRRGHQAEIDTLRLQVEHDGQRKDAPSRRSHWSETALENLEAKTDGREDKSQDLRRRIYILGVGNYATFFAHCLADIPHRPPITFLTTHKRALTYFEAAGRTLKVTVRGFTETQTGFDVELFSGRGFQAGKPSQVAPGHISGVFNDPLETDIDMPDESTRESGAGDAESTAAEEGEEEVAQEGGPIYNLVLAVKARQAVKALMPLAHRLGPQSTIVFLQIGMGISEQVAREVFPDEATRPKFILTVMNHPVQAIAAYSVYYSGQGSMWLSVLPPRKPGKPTDLSRSAKMNASALYMLKTITRTPAFVAMGVNSQDFFRRKLDDLAISAVVEPLTVLFDCDKHKLLSNFPMTRLMRLLLSEISVVFRSLPELQHLANNDTRYDAGRLEKALLKHLKFGHNQPSLSLMDVRARRRTEIESINGYIVQRGEELGLHCVTNYAVMQMVLALYNVMNEKNEGLPTHQTAVNDTPFSLT